MDRKNWKFKTGVVLIIYSFIVFGFLFIVPFLDWSAKVKIAVTTGIVISMEVAFWVGALLVGKEVVTKYKPYLNPRTWFAKSKGNVGELRD